MGTYSETIAQVEEARRLRRLQIKEWAAQQVAESEKTQTEETETTE